MLYYFKVLTWFFDLEQETVLNWFGVNTPTNHIHKFETNTLNLLSGELDSPSALSLDTLKLIIEGLWNQVQNGLTLADIESLLFFILFTRFIILTIRYNLKTSFYIVCIGLFAGYLWYRHLVDLISIYRSMLIKLPFVHKLGIDAVQLRTLNRQLVLTDLKIGENVHWYNLGQLFYYAFARGITDVDVDSGLKYYIDPISMFISNLPESEQIKILPIYYKIYNKIIPQIIEFCSKFWTQLSGIAAYAIITRIGKRYCPYLVRWHWTFLLIIGFMEQILIYFVYRVSYFQAAILVPKTQMDNFYIDQNLILQISFLNGLIAFVIFLHMGLIFFGLFHAIWGQYFYFPFIVENTELHIGPRPKTSIYSGGNTAWQDDKEKNIQRVFPKLWYGWFGSSSANTWNLVYTFQKIVKNIIKKIQRLFLG